MNNREIKFRVWHKDFQRFLTSDEWFLDLNGNLIFFYETDRVLIPADKNLYIVQQYTGLKDKGGNDIYEGDILIKYGNYSHGYDCDDTIELVERVEASPNGKYDYSGWYTQTLLLSQWQFCEIISNIFENSELLNQ